MGPPKSSLGREVSLSHLAQNFAVVPGALQHAALRGVVLRSTRDDINRWIAPP
jgi:hypothetical protein